MQQIMEEERDQQVGVLSHQRDNTKRKAVRNGYKPRSFNTRLGKLLLAQPQIREFSFQTQLIEGILNKDLKQRSKVIGIFPNQESCLRYVCLRLRKIDEEGQTGRRYMKILPEDKNSEEDDALLREIKQIKEGVKTQEELVAI